MIQRLLASFVRLRALLAKEFLQLLRDPRMRFFVVVPPLLQSLIFGYAANYDVLHARIGVVDQAGTQITRELVAAITASGHFTAQYYIAMQMAKDALDRNSIRAILRFAPDFHHQPAIQLITDGSDANSAQIIMGQLSRAIYHYSNQKRVGDPSLIQIEEQAWYNPNLEDRPYFLPGIIANLVFIITMILTAMSVVREREMGTLERLLVTPVARLEFLLGKMITVAAVGLFDVLLVTLVAVNWFKIPFRGSIPGLLTGSVLFLLSSLGIGLLISSYAKTQQQAILLAFLVIMPTVILSGFAFPINNMPEGVQWFTWLNPLRYYQVVIRDLFLKGSSLKDHGFEYGMMGLLGMITLLISLQRIGSK